MTSIHVERATDRLPDEMRQLDEDARRDGYRMVAKLKREWDSDTNRFDREGERLLIAWVDGRIAGVGGMTRDPIDADALRMRRFYVHKSRRRLGIGRQLANELLGHAGLYHRSVVVNAGTANAPAFWEAIGFVADHRDGHTHILALPDKFIERQH
jgi:GNAT superfamily N-acetyltransferase